MPNDHGIPDSLKELQSVCADLLPATILSTTFPSVPVPPGMTLSAFATTGYVRAGVDLVYVRQEAQPVPLTGADGNYWVSLTEDTFTDYAQWTRVYGTHYCWRPSSTQPADVDGLLVFCQLTVAGGAITAVTPIASRSTLAAAWRGLLGLGTLATQNANAVAITGGALTGLSGATSQFFQVQNRSGSNVIAASLEVAASGGTNRYNLYAIGDAPNYLAGPLGVQSFPAASIGIKVLFRKDSQDGIILQPTVTDTPGGSNLTFMNVAGAIVGRIMTDASSTTYSTSSDARLKHAIVPLTNTLASLRAARPIAHRWNSDDSPGEGFLAHELMVPFPLAVSGQPDEVDAQGNIVPQQVDHSKLVPRMVAWIQELLTKIETLEAQVAALQGA